MWSQNPGLPVILKQFLYKILLIFKIMPWSGNRLGWIVIKKVILKSFTQPASRNKKLSYIKSLYLHHQRLIKRSIKIHFLDYPV